MNNKAMTVSELARKTGVTADTVRHYTEKGLLYLQLVPIDSGGDPMTAHHEHSCMEVDP